MSAATFFGLGNDHLGGTFHHLEDVALLVYGVAVLIGVGCFQRDRFLADGAFGFWLRRTFHRTTSEPIFAYFSYFAQRELGEGRCGDSRCQGKCCLPASAHMNVW